MREPRLYLIEEDLAEASFEEWFAATIAAVESYLARQADFESFLDSHDAS